MVVVQHDGHVDVNARGPLGMTPLMVAAIRGGALDAGSDAEDEQTAHIISELVAQGAQLNAAMDKTGETSLHLAARYARADAAKRLLDAGADANSQDNTGRTPLHSAVAADAMGVFQILLRNRATNLNARMHDGTTPLILAARLAIEGMVEDLINADADINAADNSGKTALHWAAAVNNVDAVNVLLVHGANRDAQDDKDETPLFLGAREGSYGACRALLDALANREITDHMDRLPRDVAQERMHDDIVRLLDDHCPRPQHHHLLPSPNPHPQLISQPTVIAGAGGKGKPKKARAKPGPDSPQDQPYDNNNMHLAQIRRKPSVKKNNKKVAQEVPQSVESLGSSLSPVESPLQNLQDLPSPYDATSLYSNAMAQFPGMEQLVQHKQPPSYEDCVKTGQTLQYGGGALGASLSPPYSNHSPTHSNHTTSPHAYIGSPSPGKSRPSLPTSPAHMAALRHSHQHQHQLDAATYSALAHLSANGQHNAQLQAVMTHAAALGQVQGHHPALTNMISGIGLYGSWGIGDTFPTPSPESPDQWSSPSPQTPLTQSPHSDWSDRAALSPNDMQQTNKGATEAIYI
ncbi:Neurogenic locus Notch protein [Papilio xuthus]|uniref:Neurogenic locus Notch protein n=1 Tax=Papilio xuthus TaxID=66420 RepID=A0A194PPP0_PAPXU|nr:Neurogenic locus Notch protein [Papilio xuthus]